jgi:tRNA (guanosine-2'-O-)-methyltransferase
MQLSHQNKIELITYLRQFVSENRQKRFDTILAERTNHIQVVLEDVFQGHNAAAVLRSCDCFGIQNVHKIQDRNEDKLSDEIAMGSSNWLSIHKHPTEKESVTSV